MADFEFLINGYRRCWCLHQRRLSLVKTQATARDTSDGKKLTVNLPP
jgi:hypothetical protein